MIASAFRPASKSQPPGKCVYGRAAVGGMEVALFAADTLQMLPPRHSAPAPLEAMLAYLRSTEFLAHAQSPDDALVGADARPQALLAPAPDAVMLASL
jgi:hypothetical protein